MASQLYSALFAVSVIRFVAAVPSRQRRKTSTYRLWLIHSPDCSSFDFRVMRNSTLVTASVSVLGGGLWVGVEVSMFLGLVAAIIYGVVLLAASIHEGTHHTLDPCPSRS